MRGPIGFVPRQVRRRFRFTVEFCTASIILAHRCRQQTPVVRSEFHRRAFDRQRPRSIANGAPEARRVQAPSIDWYFII